MKYSKIKYFIYTVLISFVFSNIDSNGNPDEILKHIVSRYEQDFSFRLTANVNKIKTKIDVDMVWLGNDSMDVDRKTWIRLLEPKDLKGVNAWIWNFNDGQTKTWATKPGSGKKIEISNKKNNIGIDLSFIQIDKTMLEGINVISDTLIYDNQECYVIDFYSMRKNKKIGPLAKFWINTDNYNIYKIQRFDKRGRMLNEVVFEKYSNTNFPEKLNISDAKKKTKTFISVEYNNETDFNLKDFNPRDIE